MQAWVLCCDAPGVFFSSDIESQEEALKVRTVCYPAGLRPCLYPPTHSVATHSNTLGFHSERNGQKRLRKSETVIHEKTQCCAPGETSLEVIR